MLNLQHWLDRLDGQIAGIRQLGAAVEYAAAFGNVTAAPAQFVIPVTDSSAENLLMTGVDQYPTATIGIAFVVRNVADPRGQASHAELLALRQATAARLLNWQPADAERPVEYAGGRLLAHPDQDLWWQDNYRTVFNLRAL